MVNEHNGQRVIWRPNDGPQTEFLACSAREVLLGGSLGGGKTDALLMSALSQVSNPLHRAIFFRRSFPQLRDVVARSHELFLPLGAVFNESRHQWRFPSRAAIEFGFLDCDEDKFRYLGRAFSCICFDELTQWPGDSTDESGQAINGAYLFLMSRLRAVEGSGLRLEIRASCNPAGPGHAWVKQRWGIPDDGGASETVDPVTGYRRVFIPARVGDNPFLRNTSYAHSLEALPDKERAAYRDGRWDQYEGQCFTAWNPLLHVCKRFPIPGDWDLWRGADDGFAAPFACYWMTRDADSGTFYVIDELYRSGMLAEEVAERVKECDLSIELADGFGNVAGMNRRILKGMLDSASFSNTGQAVITRGDQMNALGCKWIPVEKFPGSRVARVKNFHRLLAPNPKAPRKPGIVFFSTCKHAIASIPALQCDSRNVEDVDDETGDGGHAFDGVTYALQYKKPICGRVRLGGI